ncbi:16500_t:CDS:2 [Cetraspora pellucida]|uniref:16500_t:CDS:1 n=1 Tax=Cetraspora pellucida TaxID=1433469 RepID=A0ACA9L9E9_9GLOM|nr:16500_t:CDS:2 [Cetraspora pellucida]
MYSNLEECNCIREDPKRLEKAQIRIMKRDRLFSSNLISTESYFEEEDAGKVNDDVSTDME